MKQPNYLDVVKKEDLNIAYLWTHFAGLTLPSDAPAAQREDMRTAFYVGFIECFRVINDISTALPEDDATEMLSRINNEGLEFFNKLMAQHMTSGVG